ncbi:hypothetical protein B0H63DRAFT_502050 [Podospora didyma]|uniref:F-box domain-containing protein n=1 Tax=Podospora didyma TaxID=330526 RepID=A0AAE0NHL8_9PEZI|nr:hypothetical protein B0H63DRAFT_502050 [Podospora didyma]
MALTLADLPDDVLLLIVANFECARDVRALAITSRRLHHLARDEGWRVFVRTRFSSLSAPMLSGGKCDWRQLAESLTWQSRCWDRRALEFQSLLPFKEPARVKGPRAKQPGPFQPVIDAHFDPETQEELVVWGAGENVVARYRLRAPRGKWSKVSWLRSEGKDLGFAAGHGDIRAIAIAKRHANHHGGGRAILTGRDNGELVLRSLEPGRYGAAEPNPFGDHIVRFSPAYADDPASGAVSGPLPLQDTILSLDVSHSGNQSLIAAATKSTVLVYGLPEDDSTEVAPLTNYNLRHDVLGNPTTQLCRATWIGQSDVLALALKGCKDSPLQYLSITPSGWTHHVAAKNADVERQFGIEYGNICPNSLQPVQPPGGQRGGNNLLLSAWRDGTCRLQDLRTPSPFDTVYQDNVEPWATMETLMTYGTERFIGGGLNGATIKIFDFRWTKGYYHTSGLPCLDKKPFPQPPQPFMKAPISKAEGRGRCSYALGLACQWHELSKELYYRPNANFFLTHHLPHKMSNTGVWSLAKASDMAPNFYIGVSGGLIEANLEVNSSNLQTSALGDPNFGFDDWKQAETFPGGYEAKPFYLPSMMETGDGLCYRNNDQSILFPRMPVGTPLPDGLDGTLRKQHRLNARFQEAPDF